MRALPKVMAGVVTLAMTGGIVAAATGTANAAYNPSSPPYASVADPNSVASVTIFDATTGAVVTGGAASTPLSSYYFVSSADFGNPDAGAGRKAALFGFLAEAGKAQGAWTGTGLGAAQTFPAATAPAPVNGFTTPTTKGGSTNTFAALASGLPNNAASTSDFYQLYQLRVKTTFPTPQSVTYSFADIKVDPAAGTWTQVNPTTDTSPRPPAAPGKPTATAGDQSASVTVPPVPGATSYTVTSSPGGFTKTGASSPLVVTGLSNGTPYTFTATATNANGTSAASPASDPVTPKAPAAATVTTVDSVLPLPATSSDDVTVTASTKSGGSPVGIGSITFTDNLDGALGTFPVSASGVASVTRKFSPTGATNHVVTATYDEGDTYATSSGQSQGFAIGYGAGNPCAAATSQCTEDQYFKATVEAGSLVISTPYTSASNAFDLGTLALNDAGTLLSSTKPFGSASIPAAADQPKATDPVSAYVSKYNGVTIVDRRPGQLGWTANLNTTDFASGTNKIDGRNLGFTGVVPTYVAGNGLQSGDVSTFQNPAAAGVAPGGTSAVTGVKGTTKFASAAADDSVGTVYVYGDMTLNAPTSTVPGLYTATVTFTIV